MFSRKINVSQSICSLPSCVSQRVRGYVDLTKQLARHALLSPYDVNEKRFEVLKESSVVSSVSTKLLHHIPPHRLDDTPTSSSAGTRHAPSPSPRSRTSTSCTT